MTRVTAPSSRFYFNHSHGLWQTLFAFMEGMRRATGVPEGLALFLQQLEFGILENAGFERVPRMPNFEDPGTLWDDFVRNREHGPIAGILNMLAEYEQADQSAFQAGVGLRFSRWLSDGILRGETISHTEILGPPTRVPSILIGEMASAAHLRDLEPGWRIFLNYAEQLDQDGVTTELRDWLAQNVSQAVRYTATGFIQMGPIFDEVRADHKSASPRPFGSPGYVTGERKPPGFWWRWFLSRNYEELCRLLEDFRTREPELFNQRAKHFFEWLQEEYTRIPDGSSE